MASPNPGALSPPASDAIDGLRLGMNHDSSASASSVDKEESVTSQAGSVKAACAGWAPMVEYSTRDADGAELRKGAHVKARASVSPVMPSAMPQHLSSHLCLDPSYGSAAPPPWKPTFHFHPTAPSARFLMLATGYSSGDNVIAQRRGSACSAKDTMVLCTCAEVRLLRHDPNHPDPVPGHGPDS